MARLPGTRFLRRESEPYAQLATFRGRKVTFPKGSTDFEAGGLGNDLDRGVVSMRVRSWRR